MEYAIDEGQLDRIERIITDDVIAAGARCAFLIDMAGNIIADAGGETYDVYSLAALSAGNFGAVNAMAQMIGEKEFSLLFHKGEKKSIYFSRVMADFLLVTIFDSETSLGFLRLKVDEAILKFRETLGAQG